MARAMGVWQRGHSPACPCFIDSQVNAPVGPQTLPFPGRRLEARKLSVGQSQVLQRLAPSRTTRSRFRCAVAKSIPVEEDSKKKEAAADAEEDEEEDDFPMWMDEEDPTWPEGEDDGYGFPVSQFFENWGKAEVKNVDKDGKIVDKKDKNGDDDEDDDEEDDELSLNWEKDEYEWIVRDIDSLEWDHVARQDPTPLIVLGFERYGSSGEKGWALLKELESMIKKILDGRKYPVRAVKLDVSLEPDLGAALKIKKLPTLLFINAGKLVYRMEGIKSAEELLQITSHLFYHSTRPSCMDDEKTRESVASVK